MNIDFEKIIDDLKQKASSISIDTDRLKDLINKTIKKLEGNKELKSLIDDVKLLIQLVKDWMSGKYKEITPDTIIIILVGFIYLVSPIDLIPDFLIGGFLDDAAVFAYILKRLASELEVYKEWKENEDNIIEIDITLDDEQ